MLDLGLISFASPWVLAAAAVLPLVWLLLRITPPAVTRVMFPAMILMFGLKPTERTPSRTPWWLVVLRMAILALVVIGLARPLINAERGNDALPLLVVIDNGWGAAGAWSARIDAARDLIGAADRRGRRVALISTAAAVPGTPLADVSFINARAALAQLEQIEPRPWQADDVAVVRALAATVIGERIETVWIADQIDGPGHAELTMRLRDMGSLSVIAADASQDPLILAPPQRTVGDSGVNRIELRLTRVDRSGSAPTIAHTIRLLDGNADVLSRATVEFAAGQSVASAGIALPTELVNRIARFDVEGRPSAAATVLADDRWQRRPVGIVTGGTQGAAAPLLDDAFYVAQALGPNAEVRTGRVDDLIKRPLSIMFIASSTDLSDAETEAARGWIDRGGVFVRFAGPRLDGSEPLLPVTLRAGGRNLGGALSWGEPAGLGAFPERSPFRALDVPADVKVRTQVLAEPSPELPDKTWAKLADGTPLVTAEQRGAGWVVLFHVSATPDWSNPPLSGLFIDMLRKLMDVGRGVGGDDGTAPESLGPVALLDGLGRQVPPGPTVGAIPSSTFASTRAGPATPPGLYGAPDNRYALNLSPSLLDARAAPPWPPGVTIRVLGNLQSERDLKPWILAAALILLLGDLALSFALRGLAFRAALQPSRAITATLLLFAAVTIAWPAWAQPTGGDKPLDATVVAAVLETRLAYIVTGNSDIDRICDAGLNALTRVLAGRTSAEMQPPNAIDLTDPTIDSDHLIPYPMLYWRVAGSQSAPSPGAIAAVNNYLRSGGMIVFDAPDQVGAIGGDTQGAAGSRLAEIVAQLDIPPLMELQPDHVLTRSFYLTNGLPGRYATGPIYIERGGAANDAVSSVIIGSRDWAAAWARDANGLPLFPMVPGGETQREYAYRAGVNMVMYALTGNYKADQVHIPAIMQRLTQ